MESSWTEKAKQYKWQIGFGSVMLLFLIVLIVILSRKTSPPPSAAPVTTASQTRTIFPIGKTFTIRSKNSGKLLQFVETKDAVAPPKEETEAGLVLEASGTSGTDPKAQWIAEELLPTQSTDFKGIGVRLKNVHYENYLRETPSLKSPSTFTYEAGTGSSLLATLAAKQLSGGTLLLGANAFQSHQGFPEMNEKNLYLLQADNKGVVQPAPALPVGNSPYWEVAKV